MAHVLFLNCINGTCQSTAIACHGFIIIICIPSPTFDEDQQEQTEGVNLNLCPRYNA